MQEIIFKCAILPFFPKGLMSGKNELSSEEEEEEEEDPGYIAPATKSLTEIQDLDQDDESLVKYKQTLLSGLPGSQGVYARPPPAGQVC